MKSDPWHFPRGELAAHMLKVMESGLVPRVAIFAPRRKGKTWFILRDLAPAAVRKAYVPVFASLWRTPDKPHLAVMNGLQTALGAIKKKRIPWSEYLSRLTAVGVSIGGMGGSLRISRASTPPTEELLELGDMLTELANDAVKKRRRILLLIDEAQHLATREAFEPIAKSLRTTMEGIEATLPDSMRTLFTGSSRTDLAALLEHRNAAFYRSFDSQELPDLDRSYTKFLSGQLKTLGRISVRAEDLWDTFNQFDRSPYYMQLVIRELMLRRAATIEQAYEIVTGNIANNPELIAKWETLSALEQWVFRRVGDGNALYSTAAVSELKHTVDGDFDVSKVQNAVRRLSRKRLISSASRGVYRSEDPELLTWCRHRE